MREKGNKILKNLLQNGSVVILNEVKDLSFLVT
jgi:hypothetical protein